jgi:flagellar hook assembly protein FlgD
VLLDDAPGTVPPAGQALQTASGEGFEGLSTGEHWLHVQAVDALGQPGETAHYRVGVTAAMAKENVYNYPNPSRDGRTSIRFPLLQPTAVEVRIYDEVGALVWSRDLNAAETFGGVNTLLWDGRNGEGREAANGGYVLTVHAGDLTVTKKIAIVR